MMRVNDSVRWPRFGVLPLEMQAKIVEVCNVYFHY